MRSRTNYFLAAFVTFEVAILGLKYVIYAVNRDWAKIEVWQVTFLVLHALRSVFPITLQVKFYRQIKSYLRQVQDQITAQSKAKTVVFAVITLSIMTFSVIWYNFIIQYYYIVHLKSRRPSPNIKDKYFLTFFVVSMVINELNFCLLLTIGYIVQRFMRDPIRRQKELRKLQTEQLSRS